LASFRFLAFRFASRHSQSLDLEAPFLGEHNQRILSSYLGYSPERVARLEQEGVLRSLPR
jgi:crotonobetainyl-CoA:carnitine CoA-transferase CaiB-like acyl-CoA transferase